MTEADERERIIEWIKAAMTHAGVTQAQLARAVWPKDRSILGKILLKRRRAQVAELAEIAAKTDYPPYVSKLSVLSPPKRDPSPKLAVSFYIKEWREFCEVAPETIAKALHIDEDDLTYLESKPYKLTIEQIETIAKALRIQFDSLRWNPLKLPAPEPAGTDIARISQRPAKKRARK